MGRFWAQRPRLVPGEHSGLSERLPLLARRGRGRRGREGFPDWKAGLHGEGSGEPARPGGWSRSPTSSLMYTQTGLASHGCSRHALQEREGHQRPALARDTGALGGYPGTPEPPRGSPRFSRKMAAGTRPHQTGHQHPLPHEPDPEMGQSSPRSRAGRAQRMAGVQVHTHAHAHMHTQSHAHTCTDPTPSRTTQACSATRLCTGWSWPRLAGELVTAKGRRDVHSCIS